ncbi:MAG: glycosyltransferase family 4 protein [Kofleriaceae bacterium]|nr:glycosyltransferase family 4 protein [Kofleriaceae bacterium]
MKILVVTGGFPTRSETFIYRKVVALARRGHEVTVATRKTGDWSIYPDALPSNVTVVELLPDHSLVVPSRALAMAVGAAQLALTATSGLRDLYELCRRDSRAAQNASKHFFRHLSFLRIRPDVVHFEFLSLGAMYPLAAEVLEVPLIVSCRGNDLHTLELRAPDEREAALDCLRKASAIHCVSDEMAGEVARIADRRAGVWVNRPAVETDRITMRAPQRAPGPLRLLATGRLIWKKGFDYLLAALARLARQGVEFEAEILGEGELHSSLRFSIEDLGLGHCVKLAGAVPSADVLARLRSADVFVLSSVEEGISNAVLEAMATGVPVVTTDAGGMNEAVTDGVEGFVVPVRDVAALADRIRRLALEPELRTRMGTAARARAEKDFSIERQIDVFEKIYHSVMQGNG